MFKIISTEIKKIVSKPGIYILSVLLAIILVLGVFIYKPKTYETSTFELKGSTFIEKYDEFNAGENAGKKAENLTKLNNSIKSINDYFIVSNSETLTQKEYISHLLAKCEEKFDAYQDCSSIEVDENSIMLEKLQLVSAYEKLNEAIENAFIKSQNNTYSILSSKSNYEDYKSSYKEVIKWAKTEVTKENLPNHFIEFQNKYQENFYDSINEFKYPKISKDFLKNYTVNEKGTDLFTLYERLNKIETQIQEAYNLSQNEPTGYNIANAKKMDELANLYDNTIDTYVNLIKYELIENAFSYLSTHEQLTAMYLSEYSEYNSKSLLNRYEYLFEHNKNEEDYSHPLTIGVSSNSKINAYDYAYFILRVFSFVIIIYAILACCHSIAGEVKEGSMRYLAIRPITRTKLFFGKWLAVIIMSIILMLFSFVISLCVGGAVYGFSSNIILSIFNGNIAFTLHPILMLGIYLLSMLLELVVYSMLAMLLSTIFKSDLVSMTILIVLYLINTLMPMFVQGVNSWLAFYPFSHISLYSLFGSSVYSVQSNFFNLLFGAKVYAGTHIALTMSIISLLIILTSAIAVKVFKHKEL